MWTSDHAIVLAGFFALDLAAAALYLWVCRQDARREAKRRDETGRPERATRR